MNQDLGSSPRHAASAVPAAPDAPPDAGESSESESGSGSGSTSASAVTPGALIGASTAAAPVTGTAGVPKVTAAPAPAHARVRREHQSRSIRVPSLPRLRPWRIVVPVAIGIWLWLLVVEMVSPHQMKLVLSHIDLTSLVGALVLAQAATVGQGLALWGGVMTYIPFDVVMRTACAMAFAELIGGPVASTASMVSLHRHHGYPAGVAYGSALLSSTAMVAVPVLLGLGFLPVAAGELHLSAVGAPGSDAALLQALLLGVVGGGLIAGVAFMAPRLRHAWGSRRWAQFDPAWAHVYEVTARVGPVVRLLAGPALTQIAYAAALGWCLHAVGAEANFSALMLVCCTASVLRGIVPVPGGMGVVEATYISGLTLAGVPQDLAAVATLLFRACTTYVPALWCWLAFARLREDDV